MVESEGFFQRAFIISIEIVLMLRGEEASGSLKFDKLRKLVIEVVGSKSKISSMSLATLEPHGYVSVQQRSF